MAVKIRRDVSDAKTSRQFAGVRESRIGAAERAGEKFVPPTEILADMTCVVVRVEVKRINEIAQRNGRRTDLNDLLKSGEGLVETADVAEDIRAIHPSGVEIEQLLRNRRGIPLNGEIDFAVFTQDEVRRAAEPPKIATPARKQTKSK